MKSLARAYRPAPRPPEGRRRVLMPLLAAGAVVAVLLGEVWQSSKLAELSLARDRLSSEIEGARARLEFRRAELERLTTRSGMAPIARQIGLRPADMNQVVLLPATYLERDEEREQTASLSLQTLPGRVARVLVPEARARGRDPR